MLVYMPLVYKKSHQIENIMVGYYIDYRTVPENQRKQEDEFHFIKS